MNELHQITDDLWLYPGQVVAIRVMSSTKNHLVGVTMADGKGYKFRRASHEEAQRKAAALAEDLTT